MPVRSTLRCVSDFRFTGWNRCGCQIWAIYDPLFKRSKNLEEGHSKRNPRSWQKDLSEQNRPVSKGVLVEMRCQHRNTADREKYFCIFEPKVSHFNDAEVLSSACTWDCWHSRIQRATHSWKCKVCSYAAAALIQTHTIIRTAARARPVHWHWTAWVNDSRLIANWERFNEHRELLLRRAHLVFSCIGIIKRDDKKVTVSRVCFDYETIFSWEKDFRKVLISLS